MWQEYALDLGAQALSIVIVCSAKETFNRSSGQVLGEFQKAAFPDDILEGVCWYWQPLFSLAGSIHHARAVNIIRAPFFDGISRIYCVPAIHTEINNTRMGSITGSICMDAITSVTAECVL
jgi:hypothetical protein